VGACGYRFRRFTIASIEAAVFSLEGGIDCYCISLTLPQVRPTTTGTSPPQFRQRIHVRFLIPPFLLPLPNAPPPLRRRLFCIYASYYGGWSLSVPQLILLALLRLLRLLLKKKCPCHDLTPAALLTPVADAGHMPNQQPNQTVRQQQLCTLHLHCSSQNSIATPPPQISPISGIHRPSLPGEDSVYRGWHFMSSVVSWQ